MNAEELEHVVGRLLEENVPPGVVARVFSLDPDLVRDAQGKVRRKRYGTDDMTDYMEQLQWEAVHDAFETLHTGSQAEKDRIRAMALSKQMTIAGRRTPQSTRDSAATLMDLMAEMRDGTPPVVERSPFIVTNTPPRLEPDDRED